VPEPDDLRGEASLRHALAQYMAHYHGERNHQGGARGSISGYCGIERGTALKLNHKPGFLDRLMSARRKSPEISNFYNVVAILLSASSPQISKRTR
jgi:hypothetical protein